MQKNWYRESPIFEVKLAHPHTISTKVPPPVPTFGYRQDIVAVKSLLFLFCMRKRM